MNNITSSVLAASFLTFVSLGYNFFKNDAAVAQCVQTDVSVQYNISGSKKPTERTNDVVMESQPGCIGNSSVTTSVQGNIGGDGPVQQNRRVRQRQTSNNSQPKPTGVNGSTVQVQSNVQVDVYNPAEKYRK
ncbi:hypothetical protein [Gloeothece verrucosa]|uniref:Uncharacterized protein n=1 Tax=Gloeothece verrucosa (strain PCC 7822) TaxID=497965 RepID=E0UK84_GLOV7|nr:hypothetical protein [Gloeothece verrucosa]ADN15846.1 hypothetical protein Cyan7822_3916 [Gloeothece verrucosa PCC 7822]